MGIFSTIADLISAALRIFIPQGKETCAKLLKKPDSASLANFNSRQGLFENLPFKQCLIRNEEMDNSLMVEDCHPIYIQEITREIIKLSWVPDIPDLFTPIDHLHKWALMVVDLPEEPVAPGIKDFNYEKIVLINSGNKLNKILYYQVDPDFYKFHPEFYDDIQKWKDRRVILYNPFVSCDYKSKPLIELPPAGQRPVWCRTYLSPAAMFQRSDGKYILLVNGESRQGKNEPPQQKVGAFISNDPWNYSFKPLNYNDITAMEPIFRGSTIHDSGDSFQITSLIKSREPNYWIGYGNGRTGDHWNVVAVKFDEDFQNIQYVKQIIVPPEFDCKKGEYFPTVIQYDNRYRMMWVNCVDDCPGTWCLTEGISEDELGPFNSNLVSSNPVLKSAKWHNGSFRSNHTHCPSYFLWQGELFCIIDGTSCWNTSGNRANRLFGVIKYDKVNQIWLEDKRNPLFINPMYGDQAWGPDWQWCADHLGGKQFFWKKANGDLLFFFSACYGFDNYKVALAKIKQFIA